MMDYMVLVHRHVFLDLTIRTIERDLKHLGNLKLNRVMSLWMERKILELKNDLHKIKGELGRRGIKIHYEKKFDEYFTEYEIHIKGNIKYKKFSNVALRNRVDEEVKRLLGLEYRTFE